MIIDLHCDTILAAYRGRRSLALYSRDGHSDLPRIKASGVGVQFFALFPDIDLDPSRALLCTLQLLDFFGDQYKECNHLMELITSQEDLDSCLTGGKIGALLTVEGGEALAGDLGVLRVLYRLGIRGLGLTWNYRNEIADGVAETETGGGLTRFGRKVVREMNRLGMIIDVSHLAEKGFWDVLELSAYPVIASHSNCRRIWDHQRNLSDEQIRGIAGQRGMVGLNFVPDFLGPAGAGLDDFLKHVDYLCDLVGDDFLGFGSDFDGTAALIPEVPDAAHFSVIIEALEKRGYRDASIKKICSDNALRLLRAVLA